MVSVGGTDQQTTVLTLAHGTALLMAIFTPSEESSRISHLGTPEKGIRRLDPNTANERRIVGPDSWLYSGQ